MEIPVNGANYGLEIKRAIRRALYFISSKMVGGLRSALISLLRRVQTKKIGGFQSLGRIWLIP
ncbi:hypothetical protein A9D60_13415 [Leisingera sp. JC1]|nr:hypothetical protein A9D60_13415 [Leisingera sp. JC1]